MLFDSTGYMSLMTIANTLGSPMKELVLGSACVASWSTGERKTLQLRLFIIKKY